MLATKYPSLIVYITEKYPPFIRVCSIGNLQKTKFLSEYTLNGESRKMGLQSKSHFLFIKRTNYVR